MIRAMGVDDEEDEQWGGVGRRVTPTTAFLNKEGRS